MEINVQLRPYQKVAIDAVRQEIVAGHKPVLSAPTGSGKTLIASEILLWPVRKISGWCSSFRS